MLDRKAFLLVYEYVCANLRQCDTRGFERDGIARPKSESENTSEVKTDHTGHLRGHLTGLPSDEVYIFLDYLRNGRGTTAIGTYSPRARDGFPIAAPVTWSRIESGILPDAFTMNSPFRARAEGL